MTEINNTIQLYAKETKLTLSMDSKELRKVRKALKEMEYSLRIKQNKGKPFYLELENNLMKKKIIFNQRDAVAIQTELKDNTATVKDAILAEQAVYKTMEYVANKLEQESISATYYSRLFPSFIFSMTAGFTLNQSIVLIQQQVETVFLKIEDLFKEYDYFKIEEVKETDDYSLEFQLVNRLTEHRTNMTLTYVENDAFCFNECTLSTAEIIDQMRQQLAILTDETDALLPTSYNAQKNYLICKGFTYPQARQLLQGYGFSVAKDRVVVKDTFEIHLTKDLSYIHLEGSQFVLLDDGKILINGKSFNNKKEFLQEQTRLLEEHLVIEEEMNEDTLTELEETIRNM